MRLNILTTLPALLAMHAMTFAAEAETGSAEAPTAEAEAPKPEKAPKPKLEEQNGVTQPAEGTKTRRVWDIANDISGEKGRPALRDEVMERALAEGMNRGTIATQYGKWCTFYGVSVDARKSVRAENREATEAEKKAAKAAEKEQAKAAAAEVEPEQPNLADQVSGDEDDNEE